MESSLPLENCHSLTLVSVLPCILLGSLLPISALRAGVIAAAGVHGIASSFRPVQEEDTPNYSGYGLLVQLGYSYNDWLELSFDSDYSQLRSGKTTDAELLAYGICLATQLGEAGLLGISYQQGRLSWPMTNESGADSRPGRWQGGLLGLRLGGLVELSDGWAFQVALQYRNGRLRQQNMPALASGEVERTVDTFALGVTYLFKSPSRQLRWSFY